MKILDIISLLGMIGHSRHMRMPDPRFWKHNKQSDLQLQHQVGPASVTLRGLPEAATASGMAGPTLPQTEVSISEVRHSINSSSSLDIIN